MIRIVVTGSEITGKTTVAHQLGRHYDAPVSEEFVRTYTAGVGTPGFKDHGPIARGQMASEDAAIARASKLVVLDTDLVSTVVYCEHYFGHAPEWIAEDRADGILVGDAGHRLTGFLIVVATTPLRMLPNRVGAHVADPVH